VPVLPCAWPRRRYDQLMDIGWTRLIPLGLGVVLLNVAVMMMKGSPEC
jgi:NADH:ubiquinone oxidoreductase subunit H